MRHSILAAALAVAMGSTSFAAAAQSSEIEELKAQLAALQAKVTELEERSDAQSDVNIDTAGQLDKLTTGAPKIETKGGIKVTSADGNFEAAIGGRIHYDSYFFGDDASGTTGGSEFRRARLTLTGKAFGWEYKVEEDFAGGSNLTDGFKDIYIAKNALGGKFTIGHFKPYRAMEELTSSNEILIEERPFASATGLFSGRQHQMGVGYLTAGANGNYTAGLSVFNLRGNSIARNEGIGYAGRVTWAPINNDNNTLHVGGWFSNENANKGSPALVATSNYAGRRGPTATLATTAAGAEDSEVTAYGLELAGSFGPLFFQSEYAQGTYETPAGDQDIDTYYVQGSWIINGGHKPYKSGTGVFGSPKVADKGLWEVVARYDVAERTDVDGIETNSTAIGMNYYVNSNLRFMLNHVLGENEGADLDTSQWALRTQFNW